MNESIQDAGQPESSPVLEPRLSPGGMLSRRRLERGMSLDDVAQRLKYGVRQIQALEGDDYPRLPGPTFVRGMIRSYAKLLELDPAPLLSELQRREIPAQVMVDLRTKRIPFPDGAKRSTQVYAVMSGVVVLIAAAVIFEWQVGFAALGPATFQKSGSDLPVATDDPSFPSEAKPTEVARINTDAGQSATQDVPVVQANVLIAPGPSATVATGVALPAPAVVRAPRPDPANHKARIVLQFQRDSWVEIKQGDGRIIMSQMNRSGSEQELGGNPPFHVVIGNAPNVRLVYNGQTVDLRPHFKVDVARLTLE